ncbi:hypothetical protein [Streptomyces sp. V3I7]|uniref:hypothetical protein n=1 Tax=Streptomyces sp. V3I7 TaxID=3042278 RepID=UPI002784FDB3|nr:hypothetical protein [Streptomyces sp. V3I7]MDQ0994756.1 hypothetical protein [Streptomyces sp. V3I7]
MTTSVPRSPRLLFVTAVVLAVTGLFFLCVAPGATSRPSSPASPTATAPAPATASAPAVRSGPAETGTPAPLSAASSSPSDLAGASALPPHGEGVAGDREIQRTLEAAWPSDLPAGDEQELLAAGRELLAADATGVGRARWPEFFGGTDQTVAPAFASARFRVQAAVARRDSAPGRAVVHLVWAGTDRGGTYTDGRITDLYFTHTISEKGGASTWTPQPRP